MTVKPIALATIAVASLAACQVDDEEAGLETLESVSVPPQIPECGQPVFWLGEHSGIYTPWYDPVWAHAGAAWTGSAAPSGVIAVRGVTGTFTGGTVHYAYSGWYAVVTDQANPTAAGHTHAEFYFDIWGQQRHCYVVAAVGPA
jgi:hypothetical protein